VSTRQAYLSRLEGTLGPGVRGWSIVLVPRDSTPTGQPSQEPDDNPGFVSPNVPGRKNSELSRLDSEQVDG
jgi:hypothetical protein